MLVRSRTGTTWTYSSGKLPTASSFYLQVPRRHLPVLHHRKVFFNFSVRQQINIASFLVNEGYMKEMESLKIPKIIKRKACLVGADNSDKSEEVLR